MSAGPAEALRADILDSFELLMQHVMRWRQVEMLDVEVTMSQARCLMLVAVRPAVPISALAAQLHVGLPAASALVERLVEAGHLARNPDPRDRRQQLVTLTPAGQVLVDRFRELPAEKLGQLLTGLSERELRSLRLGIAAIEREARLVADRPTSDPDSGRTPA